MKRNIIFFHTPTISPAAIKDSTLVKFSPASHTLSTLRGHTPINPSSPVGLIRCSAPSAVWAYTAAIGFASLAVASLGGMFGNIYHYQFGQFNGKPLPPMTDFLIKYYWWAFALPLPWLLAAIWLSRRGAATPDRVFAFAGVSTLAIAFLFTFTAIALPLPFVELIKGMR